MTGCVAYFDVGCRVTVSSKCSGVVRFVGGTDFADGIWIGVELDEPVGKNDGTVKGKVYFSCGAAKGIFCRPSALTVDVSALVGAALPQGSNKKPGRPLGQRGSHRKVTASRPSISSVQEGGPPRKSTGSFSTGSAEGRPASRPSVKPGEAAAGQIKASTSASTAASTAGTSSPRPSLKESGGYSSSSVTKARGAEDKLRTPGSDSGSPKESPRPEKRHSTSTPNKLEVDSHSGNHDKEEPVEENLKLGKEALVVGARAVVVNKGQKLQGEIGFVGLTEFSEGQWVGIALDTPDGKNDGTVKGVRYFTCNPGHGLFVRSRMVLPLLPAPARKIPTFGESSVADLLDDENFNCDVGEADGSTEVRSLAALHRLWRSHGRYILFVFRLKKAVRLRREAAVKIQACRRGQSVRKTTNQQLLEMEDDRLMRNPKAEDREETQAQVMAARESLKLIAPMLEGLHHRPALEGIAEGGEEEPEWDEDDEDDDDMTFF